MPEQVSQNEEHVGGAFRQAAHVIRIPGAAERDILDVRFVDIGKLRTKIEASRRLPYLASPDITDLQRGLAPDGGLYVPEAFPRFELRDFDGLDAFPDFAERCLSPFLAGDRLEPELSEICREAFSFPIPLKELRPGTSILTPAKACTASVSATATRPRRRGYGLTLVPTISSDCLPLIVS